MLLVTGASGQLGMSFQKLLSKDQAYFSKKDITKALNISDFPNISGIINCAAYTNVDKAEEEKEEAFEVNAQAVKNLCDFANQLGIPLIHFSTDYVFPGNASQPYSPEDPTSPLGIYGESKLAGEKIFLDTIHKGALIRTSWVYSQFGHNFVKTMLRLGKEKGQIKVVNDQLGSPTYATDLASFTLSLLKDGNLKPKIYHYTNTGEISWYEFAREIMKEAGLNCKVSPCRSEDFPTAATRPKYSVLKCQQEQIDWKESLKLCLKKLSL